MGRLRGLRPQIKALPSALGRLPNDAGGGAVPDRDAPGWRRWYKTSRWQKLRMATLVRDLFTCQMCGRIEANTSLLVADHRRPHRGDEAMFWDPENLQALCKSPCHDRHKQRMEQAIW